MKAGRVGRVYGDLQNPQNCMLLSFMKMGHESKTNYFDEMFIFCVETRGYSFIVPETWSYQTCQLKTNKHNDKFYNVTLGLDIRHESS